ncbi:MAG: hypothetical protein ABW003_01850 [Microvirga sp.]
MTDPATLEAIRLGTAPADIARKAIAEALQDVNSKTAQRIYSTLRAWVWKALDQRRRDDELRQWFDILKRTEAYLATDHGDIAARIRALHELVYESISVSELKPAQEVLRRKHVRDVLFLLYTAPSGKLDRSTILHLLKLRQSNLTRILNLMMEALLVERSSLGKEAYLQLTRDGVSIAEAEMGTLDTGHIPPILSGIPRHGRIAPMEVMVEGRRVIFDPRPGDTWTGNKSAEYLGLRTTDELVRHMREVQTTRSKVVIALETEGFGFKSGFVKEPEWNHGSRAAKLGYASFSHMMEDDDGR